MQTRSTSEASFDHCNSGFHSLSGKLWKRTPEKRRWQRRHVNIKDGILTWSMLTTDSTPGVQRGYLSLRQNHCVVQADQDDAQQFSLSPVKQWAVGKFTGVKDGRIFHFDASCSEHSREKWMEIFNDNMDAIMRRKTLANPRTFLSLKADLVTALQKKGKFGACSADEMEVTNVLLRTRGEDLLVLKNMLDMGGDYFSLHKLVFSDLRDDAHRQKLLEHFAVHQTKVDAVKVLSDIDDTLYCSGGHFPAGVDVRYPKHAVYPGVLELFFQLDKQEKELWEETHDNTANSYCNLVFLSARPHVYKDTSERVSYRLFKQLQDTGQLHTTPTLVPGDLPSSLKAVMKSLCGRPDPWYKVGAQKYMAMQRFQQLYPDYDFLFFGDTGQGDLVAAELANSEGKVPLKACFLHEVIPRACATTALHELPEGVREVRWRELRIFFVRSPVQAATHAQELGLLSQEGLREVCQVAARDLEDLIARFPRFPHWPARYKELKRDLEDARMNVTLANLRF